MAQCSGLKGRVAVGVAVHLGLEHAEERMGFVVDVCFDSALAAAVDGVEAFLDSHGDLLASLGHRW